MGRGARCTDLVKGRLDDFLADLCVGSGVGDAGCKTAIGTRLKWSGMHWTVAGANAVIALSCCKLSGRYEDFWVYRSAHSQGNLRNLTYSQDKTI